MMTKTQILQQQQQRALTRNRKNCVSRCIDSASQWLELQFYIQAGIFNAVQPRSIALVLSFNNARDDSRGATLHVVSSASVAYTCVHTIHYCYPTLGYHRKRKQASRLPIEFFKENCRIDNLFIIQVACVIIMEKGFTIYYLLLCGMKRFFFVDDFYQSKLAVKGDI
jgi:hypothetical protein